MRKVLLVGMIVFAACSSGRLLAQSSGYDVIETVNFNMLTAEIDKWVMKPCYLAKVVFGLNGGEYSHFVGASVNGMADTLALSEVLMLGDEYGNYVVKLATLASEVEHLSAGDRIELYLQEFAACQSIINNGGDWPD